ncbi:MAG: hypothetical protein MJE77_08880 [Proteobacteria bacterium]|nr:hypothetical protein [Pseudomonadota bacterium]
MRNENNGNNDRRGDDDNLGSGSGDGRDGRSGAGSNGPVGNGNDGQGGDGSNDQADNNSAGVDDGQAPSVNLHGPSSTGVDQSKHFYETNIRNVFAANVVHKLIYEDFHKYARSHFLQQNRQIVSNPQDDGKLADKLGSYRITLMIGPAELGKRTIATGTAASLCHNQELKGVLDCKINLEQNVAVDLAALIKDDRFRDHIVLFKNAFHHQNNDLQEFAREVEDANFQDLCEQLKRRNVFIIFTSDDSKIKNLAASIDRVQVQLQGPDKPARRKFLEDEALRRLAEADSVRAAQESSPLSSWLGDGVDLVLDKIDTIPKLCRFVRSYFAPLLGNELTVAEAVDHFGNVDSWLLEDKANDLDLLTYATTLTLCSVSPDLGNPSWYQFDLLRRRVYHCIRRELRQSGQPRDSTSLCVEKQVIEELDAVVESELGGGVIRFKQEERAETFWECLLGNGRVLLSTVVPVLNKLLESEYSPLQALCARALGRIGQLEPNSLIVPLLANPQGKPAVSDWRSLGALMQGVLASKSTQYIETVLSHYQNVLADEKVGGAILSLAEIAEISLPRAMNELHTVITTHLVQRLEDLAHGEQQFRELVARQQRVGRPFGGRVDFQRTDKDWDWLELLVLIYPPGEKLEIFLRVIMAILRMFDHGGALPVIQTILSWISPGQQQLTAFLSLAFLWEGCVFDVLETNAEGDDECWSPVLRSGADTVDGAEQLVEFLVEIYIVIDNLIQPLQPTLRERWLLLLRCWAEQASRRQTHRKGQKRREFVIDVFSRLLHAPDKEIQERVWDMLVADADFADRNSRMGQLKHEIISRN